jgi:hypothetical protein
MYKRCIYKTGMSSYFCIDAGNKSAIKDKAIKLYTQLYVNFARFEHPTLPTTPSANRFRQRRHVLGFQVLLTSAPGELQNPRCGSGPSYNGLEASNETDRKGSLPPRFPLWGRSTRHCVPSSCDSDTVESSAQSQGCCGKNIQCPEVVEHEGCQVAARRGHNGKQERNSDGQPSTKR